MTAWPIVSLTLWTALISNQPPTGADHPASQVRVMSFNIRYGTANDGENHWDTRKQFLVETIRAFDPDLLGTQETLGFQRDFLADKLPRYEHLGVGRDDGKHRGEMTALYYKKDRYEKLDGGHFWLSETPDKPGSKSWDSSLTRMATWVKLRDRQNKKALPTVFCNTHFDHRGSKARVESARLIRKEVQRLGKGSTMIVTGDFNTGEGTEPYQALFGAVDRQPSLLIDTYRSFHPQRESNEGTFSSFRPTANLGARIDWIACSRDWKVLRAAIDRTERNGRTPSDHFPVTAILQK